VIELDLQIASIKRQMTQQQARLTSSERQTLNRAIEEFTRLQMNAEFAQDMYKTALAALEKGRVDSVRTVKMVSVIQSPTVPQYPMEPRRIYNTTVFIVATHTDRIDRAGIRQSCIGAESRFIGEPLWAIWRKSTPADPTAATQTGSFPGESRASSTGFTAGIGRRDSPWTAAISCQHSESE
jgi:hypothetical protein